MSEEVARFLEGTASFADIVFGASEESNDSLDKFCENEEDFEESVEENKAFWERQYQLLQATICRTSSIESKVRQATKEALSELNLLGLECLCRKPLARGCRNCLRRELSVRLQNAGYNSAICKSKWKSSQEIPPGQHSYLEVLEKLSSKRGEMRVVIELNFRSEFEMARASEEYKRLISRLPKVFVGKTERLKALIKILCAAAEKCMKEKKMYMAPWRKQKYILAKWLGTYERTIPTTLPVRYSDRPPKPKASILTFDLVDNLPILHCSTAVEVL